jgi:hypothetical protein
MTNPFTTLETRRRMSAFITNKKMPKVSTVTGSVRRTRIGFTKMFAKPSTAATSSAVQEEAK